MRLIFLVVMFIISTPAFSGALEQILNSPNLMPSHPLSMDTLVPATRQQTSEIRQGQTSFLMAEKSSVMIVANSSTNIVDGRQTLPNITFDWVQNDVGEVIPTIRHLVLSDSPHWDYFLGVGVKWPNVSGHQSSWVSLPFTLVEKNENCTHNGVIVFDSGQPQGHFYFQISSETCAYFKADFWGRGKATNTAVVLQNHAEIAAKYKQEKQQRMVTQPLSSLAEHGENLNLENLALPNKIDPLDMTAYGLVMDDIHYVSNCQTRAGNYPFCHQLVLPSYSTAKSLFAGLAVFFLQQRYGDVLDQPISKWVKQCQSENWQGVTFSHLLDMSTGHYQSSGYSVDEASPQKMAFFSAKTSSERLAFACKHYPRKNKPGQTFVYHTSDTYLLGVGLDAYLKKQLGESADLFDDLLYSNIFQPLGLSEVTAKTRRTSGKQHQPYVGYGLFFTRDDLVRLSRFVVQQALSEQASSLLAQQPLREALQKVPSHRGLPTDYPHIRYQHGFWARKTDKKSACDPPHWIPFMSGFGGITVALLSEKSSYYYFSDSYQFDWSEAIPTFSQLQLICKNSAAVGHADQNGNNK